MTAKITFTQKEQDELRTVLALNSGKYGALVKLHDKMVKARETTKIKFSGVSVQRVFELARESFGVRFKTPDTITTELVVKLQRVINSCGIDEPIAVKAISNCSWTGDIWAETFVYSMSKLAAGVSAGSQLKMGFTPTKQSGWLGQLDE